MWNDNDLVIIERLAKSAKITRILLFARLRNNLKTILKQVSREYFKRCSDLPTKIG